jgi:hypothetical protein
MLARLMLFLVTQGIPKIATIRCLSRAQEQDYACDLVHPLKAAFLIEWAHFPTAPLRRLLAFPTFTGSEESHPADADGFLPCEWQREFTIVLIKTTEEKELQYSSIALLMNEGSQSPGFSTTSTDDE